MGIFTCSCKKGLNNMKERMPARAAWPSQLEAIRPNKTNLSLRPWPMPMAHKNGHLYCQMGEKEQVVRSPPAVRSLLQGSLTFLWRISREPYSMYAIGVGVFVFLFHPGLCRRLSHQTNAQPKPSHRRRPCASLSVGRRAGRAARRRRTRGRPRHLPRTSWRASRGR